MFKRLYHRIDHDNTVDPEVPPGDTQRDEEHVEEPSAKRARFELDDDSHDSWELPAALCDYVHKYMKSHIPDKDVKEKVLAQNPVPSNIRKVPELDSYIKILLQDNSKYSTLKMEKAFKNVHDKLHLVFGPLSKIWAMMDSEKEQNPKDEALKEVSNLFEQTILLLAQTHNSMAYHRRENVLSTLIDSTTKVKDILKNQSKELDAADNDCLFGDAFESKMIKDSKALKKSEGIFTGLKSPRTSTSSSRGASSSSGFSGNRPFRKGPLFQGRGRGNNLWKGSNQNRGKTTSFNFSTCCVFKGRGASFLDKGSSFSKRLVSTSTATEFISGREAKLLYSELGGSDSGSRDSSMGPRVPSAFSVSSSTNSSSSSSQVNSRGGDSSRKRGSGNVSQRGHKEGCFPRSEPVSKLDISGSQEGWGVQTGHKSKKIESEHSIRALQDGNLGSVEGALEERGLHVQNRPERCLFFSSSSPTLSEICKVSMETKDLPVCVPLFRSRTCSKNFFKIDEGSNSNVETTKCPPHHLSRRLFNPGRDSPKGRDGTRHFDFHSSTSRILNKSEKIRVTTNTFNSISGSRGGFRQFETGFTLGEDGKNIVPVQRSIVCIKGLSKGSDEGDRSSFFISSGGTSSTPAIQSYAKTTNFRAVCQGKLRLFDNTDTGRERGAQLVVPEPTVVKWAVSGVMSSSTSNIIGCIPSGVGGLLQWQENRRSMVRFGEKPAYKCSRIESGKTSNTFISSVTPRSSVHSHSDGQHCGTNLSQEDGWHSKRTIEQSDSGDLEVSSGPPDHDYCGVPPRKAQCGSRFHVTECERLKRMDVESECVSGAVQSKGNSVHRPVCFKIDSSSAPVLCLENRPIQQGTGCISGMLETYPRLRLPSILPNRKSVMEGPVRLCDINCYCPSLANTNLVSSVTPLICTKADTFTSEKGFIVKPTGTKPPASSKSNSSVSGLDSFRGSLETIGISQKASNLITASRRSGTISHYQSAWNKWSSWCRRQQVDPVRCAINFVIEFLSDSFHEGLEHSTIAGYRSAISAYHEPIDGVAVGKHPLVSSLLAGVHNQRFPQPKYTFIWDVERVVTFLSSISLQNISDKMLTLKLTMLLALTSAARAHEVAYLDVRYLVKHHSGYSFHFGKPTKTAKQRKPRPPLKFMHFKEDLNLCVCNHIDVYLERSSPWRGENFQLLLSFVKPHKAVKPCTISRWILEVLTLSGIDTSTFKGHSTRSASSSKAVVQGVPMTEILKKGHWTTSTTFERTYRKEILVEPEIFESAVLTL